MVATSHVHVVMARGEGLASLFPTGRDKKYARRDKKLIYARRDKKIRETRQEIATRNSRDATRNKKFARRDKKFMRRRDKKIRRENRREIHATRKSTRKSRRNEKIVGCLLRLLHDVPLPSVAILHPVRALSVRMKDQGTP
jgi:hypothetical protein